MSLIVRVIDSMDRMLSHAHNENKSPDHFLLRAEDWAEIKERFKTYPPFEPIDGETYKRVPVRTGELGNDNLATLRF